MLEYTECPSYNLKKQCHIITIHKVFLDDGNVLCPFTDCHKHLYHSVLRRILLKERKAN